MPDVNARWMGDKIRRYKKADISVAVQTERGSDGAHRAERVRLGLAGISSEVRRSRARRRRASSTPADMIGGTFTI